MRLSSGCLGFALLLAFSGCLSYGSAAPYNRYTGAAPPRAAEDTAIANIGDGFNPWIEAVTEDTSTFAVDVDTGSYTLTRRALMEGQTPDPSTVRVEEFVNFFPYSYPEPESGPFSVSWEGAPSPFGAGRTLLRIALQGRHVAADARARANLIFLIDVSGSMQSADKLGLVQFALGELTRNLAPDDTVGIVVYAGREAVALPPTPISERARILDIVEGLSAGGSTAGEAGIRAAYELAQRAFVPGGINRVVLCTDGDFNVGLTGEALISLIEEKREEGVFLTTLGFGTGNYRDSTLEQLADHGNGNYAYVDNRGEAVRVLGENLVSTLAVIAKDVKVQVEFNAALVQRYRLVGYDNRLLQNDQFRDDTVDAGEIGAGHQVTAFYEVELTGGADALATESPLAVLRLRHKEPDADVASEQTFDWQRGDLRASFEEASADFRFASAVVELAEQLRQSPHASMRALDDVRATAEAATLDRPEREELTVLIERAAALATP